MDKEMQAAIQAAKSGDNETARELLRGILKKEPNDESAWLWLSQAVDTDEERSFCLQQVLRVNPDNRAARQGLDHLEQRTSAATQPEEESPAAAGPDAALGPGTLEEVAAEPGDAGDTEPAVAPELEAGAGDELKTAAVMGAAAVAASGTEAGPPEGGTTIEQPVAEPGVSDEPELGAGIGVTPVLLPELDDELEPGDDAAPAGEPEADGEAASEVGTIVEPVPGAGTLVEPVPEPVPVMERPRRRGCCTVVALVTLLVALIACAAAIDAMYSRAPQVEQISRRLGLPLPSFLQAPTSGVKESPPASAATAVSETGVTVEATTGSTAPPPGGAEPESSAVETPAAADDTATPVPETPKPSVANAAELAPVRINNLSFYPSSTGGIISMTVGVDAVGDSRITFDAFGAVEEWLVIDDLIFAGVRPAQGLVPFEPVDDAPGAAVLRPSKEILAPGEALDRFTAAFPLHSVLEAWEPDPVHEGALEVVHGLEAVTYRVIVDPAHLPETVWTGEAQLMSKADLVEAVESEESNQVAIVWVEPDSGAIVKAQWRLVFADGQRAEYSLDVVPGPVAEIELPVEAAEAVAGLANPSASYCEDQDYLYVIRTAADGSQSGYCLFSDGSECEAWAYYRGECRPGEDLPTEPITSTLTLTPTGVTTPEVQTTPEAGTSTPAATARATPLPPTTPEGAVETYWSHVGAGEYEEAWELLSASFQGRRYHDEPAEYAAGFKAMQLCGVVAGDIRAVDQSTLRTVLKATIVYQSGPTCRASAYHFELTLLYNEETAGWQIDDIVWK